MRCRVAVCCGVCPEYVALEYLVALQYHVALQNLAVEYRVALHYVALQYLENRSSEAVACSHVMR